MRSWPVRNQLFLLFAFVFIDVLGFSLILPLLPYYAAAFAATPTMVGLLLGANAAAQFIGAPILGRLSDRHGRRPLLILSIGGTVVSFVVLGLARSLVMLFVSRILDGLLGGDISLAQAYISDVTDEKSRARGLGLIGAAFGLGFIFGPAMGGTLSAGGSFSLPAFVAAGLAAVNLLGIVFWLPESLPARERAALSESPRTGVSIRALREALARPCVGPLLYVLTLFSLAFTTFQTVFALFAQKRLALDAQGTSYVLTYVGLLIVAVQGGGIAWLSGRLADKQLIFGGSALLSLSLLAWALTPTVWALLVILAPLALAGGVLSVTIQSALTKSVYPEEIGGTLGLSASLGSFARIISPIAGGVLLDSVSPAAPGFLGALLMGWLVAYIWRRVLFVPDLICPEPRVNGLSGREADKGAAAI